MACPDRQGGSNGDGSGRIGQWQAHVESLAFGIVIVIVIWTTALDACFQNSRVSVPTLP